MLKLVVRYGILTLLVLGALIQLLPVDRSVPPVESDIPTTPEVKTILRRACYDCHSHETQWPWYSYVAPVSWVVVQDVHKGRDDLNFSLWNRYHRKEQAKKLQESWEEIAEGKMPPRYYTLLHRTARLSDQDRAVLQLWFNTVKGEDHGTPGKTPEPS